MLSSLVGSAEIVTYPADSDVPTLEDYTVMVSNNGSDWQPVSVYPVKVDRVANTKHNVEIASMSYFDFSDNVEVKVISNRCKIDSVRIRPLSYNITPAVSGDTLTFSLSRPSNLSIEVNGDIFHNLHLFANPIDNNRPTAKEIKRGRKRGDLIYFAPGMHHLPGDTLLIPSCTRVYVDGGARVLGTLILEGVQDINIGGRGEIHPIGRGAGIEIRRSKNVNVDGVIMTQLPIGESDSINISNVKAISSYGWGDGMNVFAANNVHYDGVFCRNSDDSHTVYATRKGFVGGSKNITMENSTLWADVAHPIMIGLHGSARELGEDATPDTIQNLYYRNIDILDHNEKQIDYQGCFAINCGDNNLVKDVRFEDIRVEDFRQGQLFNIRIFYNKKYCAAPGLGVSNIHFKDIDYNGNNSELSIISGYNTERRISDLTFENVKINGVCLSDTMPDKPAWYKTGDMGRIYIGEHVNNVIFK